MPIDYVIAQEAISMDNELEWQPQLGKVFNTWEEAWKFWKNYGGKMGFDVRKQYFNKSKDNDFDRKICV